MMKVTLTALSFKLCMTKSERTVRDIKTISFSSSIVLVKYCRNQGITHD